METFSALLALCAGNSAGNSSVPVNYPHKGQWRGALIFSVICAWINGWVNHREAGDLRRYRTHYDVTVMVMWSCPFLSNQTRRLTMTHCIGCDHYNYVIISTIVSQITSLTIVYSSVWVNTSEAGDLRCHRAHYDVTVITSKLGATVSPKHQSQLQSKMIYRWWWHLNFRNTECTCQKLKLIQNVLSRKWSQLLNVKTIGSVPWIG